MPASFGVQGPGDSTIAFGFSFERRRNRDLVVAHDLGHRAKLAQVVDEVVGEAVVVIDQEEHGAI